MQRLIETIQAYIHAVNRYRQHLFDQYTQSNDYYEQHYNTMAELQQFEYRDLINVRKEILNRFQWVINELEQTLDNLQSRRLSVADAQQNIDRPLMKEVSLILLTYLFSWFVSFSLDRCSHMFRLSNHLSMLIYLHLMNKRQGLKHVKHACQPKINGVFTRAIYKTRKKIYTLSIHSFIEEFPKFDLFLFVSKLISFFFGLIFLF